MGSLYCNLSQTAICRLEPHSVIHCKKFKCVCLSHVFSPSLRYVPSVMSKEQVLQVAQPFRIRPYWKWKTRQIQKFGSSVWRLVRANAYNFAFILFPPTISNKNEHLAQLPWLLKPQIFTIRSNKHRKSSQIQYLLCYLQALPPASSNQIYYTSNLPLTKRHDAHERDSAFASMAFPPVSSSFFIRIPEPNSKLNYQLVHFNPKISTTSI